MSGRPREAIERLALVPDLDDEILEMRKNQALAILDALESWADRPGLGFSVVRNADGNFTATFIEVERRSSKGSSVADALSQIGTVARMEVESRRRTG